MSHADEGVAQHVLDRLGKIQKPHAVGYGGAGFAYPLGDVPLLHAEFRFQAHVAGGLFQRAEVFTLEVFNQRQLQHVLVGSLPDDGGHGGQAQDAGSAPAPFPGNELILAAFRFPDDQRLDDAVLLDGVHQLRQLFRGKDGARLEGAGNNGGMG